MQARAGALSAVESVNTRARELLMKEEFLRMWHDIAARPSGPFAFRFYIQPLMAVLLATRDGLRDARAGRPAYFWALFTDPRNRSERIRDGMNSIGKVFVLAFILDTLYQLLVLRGLRPIEGLIVAVMLAIIPYVLLRGPVERIARRLGRRVHRVR
jgi:hypothetical protein